MKFIFEFKQIMYKKMFTYRFGRKLLKLSLNKKITYAFYLKQYIPFSNASCTSDACCVFFIYLTYILYIF